MTRVAGANPRIWVDIFLENATALASALAEHRRRIEQLEPALAPGDAGFLARWIGEAAAQPPPPARDRLRRRRRAAAAARPRPRPARRARGDHAGARRRADQHRGLRAPARLARARRHAHDPRRGRGRGRARGRLLEARATASSSRRCSRRIVKIEPAAALAGDIAVPGDKSISHRALLLGADRGRRDAHPRLRPLRRHRGDDRRGARARRRSRRGRPTTLRVHGAGLRGLRAPAEPIDCGNAGTLMRLLAGHPRRPGRPLRARRATSRSRARPLERIAEPLRQMGARIETTDGHAPLTIEGGAAAADPLRAARRERAGQVGRPPRRPLRRRGATTVVEPLPTRDHTERLLAALGARATRRAARGLGRPPSGSSSARSTSPATSPRPRRSSSRRRSLPGSRADDPRRRRQPAPHGPARRARADGRAHRPLQPAAVGGEPVGDLEVRLAELVGDRVAADEVPLLVDELPLFALARRARARRQRASAARRSCA